MRLYLVAYHTVEMECVGAAIVSVPVAGMAKRAAEEKGLSIPGHVAIETELAPRSVPKGLIGRKLTSKDIRNLLVKKPPAKSIRRAG